MLNLFLLIVKKILSKVCGDDRLNVTSGCNGGRLKLLNVGGGGCGGGEMKLLNDGGGGGRGCSGGIKLLNVGGVDNGCEKLFLLLLLKKYLLLKHLALFVSQLFLTAYNKQRDLKPNH